MISKINYSMSKINNSFSLMIPAYLRGDLSEEEKAQIEKSAEENAVIAAEIEFQKRLIDSLKETHKDDSFNESGWLRLRDSIRKEPK